MRSGRGTPPNHCSTPCHPRSWVSRSIRRASAGDLPWSPSRLLVSARLSGAGPGALRRRGECRDRVPVGWATAWRRTRHRTRRRARGVTAGSRATGARRMSLGCVLPLCRTAPRIWSCPCSAALTFDRPDIEDIYPFSADQIQSSKQAQKATSRTRTPGTARFGSIRLAIGPHRGRSEPVSPRPVGRLPPSTLGARKHGTGAVRGVAPRPRVGRFSSPRHRRGEPGRPVGPSASRPRRPMSIGRA
ncbi:hypothetical protein FHR81_004504 [Actinoalloteichus hoggarensis]|uniref:Uncharacterized protein n=1 Tax=Actinoalloteichus hoggarensis TaxID=1470176 RepID=A0A221W3J4_9PSEU|nr:hypothetical protein AHOG_13760 [Actinoalloteichus hoggarensis]MBB5923433.1 hypothetical protein [Actinoalloteichus hoggarensis]